MDPRTLLLDFLLSVLDLPSFLEDALEEAAFSALAASSFSFFDVFFLEAVDVFVLLRFAFFGSGGSSSESSNMAGVLVFLLVLRRLGNSSSSSFLAGVGAGADGRA